MLWNVYCKKAEYFANFVKSHGLKTRNGRKWQIKLCMILYLNNTGSLNCACL